MGRRMRLSRLLHHQQQLLLLQATLMRKCVHRV
jgi:hypothetical protein